MVASVTAIYEDRRHILRRRRRRY